MVVKIIGRFVNNLLDRIVVVIGAVACSQIPQFIMQYTRVLEGALAEAKRNLAVATAKAAELGLSLQEFVDAHLRNPDPVFQKSGEVYREAILRYEDYQSALQGLHDASAFTRPFVFFTRLDTGLLGAMNFTPGIPLDTEGLIYALCGILIGLSLYHGLLLLPRWLLHRRKQRLATDAY
ncbi:MAG: DUF2937 family protein [Leptospiraceae bacterium]|nr:DUF2937 family protein [Leptospiraceae bacterium]